MIEMSVNKDLLEKPKDVKIGQCYKCGKMMECEETTLELARDVIHRWWSCGPCDFWVCEYSYSGLS